MLAEVYLFFVFMLSSFLQTTTGFGFAIITAPLLALVVDAKETVMLVMITGLMVKLLLLRVIKDEGSFTDILPLMTAGVAGAIPGAYLLAIISSDGLKLFIGVVLLAATLAMWKNYTINIANPRYAEAIVGAVSGFLATTTSVNGPPIILYYLNTKADANKAAFRANLTRYFLLMSAASILISYLVGNLHFGDLWSRVLLAVPALYAGVYAGEKAFHRINAKTFRTVSLVMVFASSLTIVSTVLMKHL